jgi:hydroxypyruvate isomerase
MPRFAANLTLMFNEWPFLDRFAAARDAGFEAVEYLFPYEHPPEAIARRLAGNGLSQALFNCPAGDWAKGERGVAVFPDRRAEFESAIAKALIYARATGTKKLHLMAGLAPANDVAAANAYDSALRWACEKAAAHGIGILIEPLNTRDNPGYFLDSFDAAAKIISRLALPNLKLQFDIYHRQILHGDVIRGLETMMPIVGHVQTASVPERHEPGTGELDDARIFATLDRLGYDGYVGCEYRPAGETVAGLGWLERYRI